MIKLQIHEHHVHLAMEENVMDILTIIPIEDIESKDIPYVKFIIQEKFKNPKRVAKDTKNKNGLIFGIISKNFGYLQESLQRHRIFAFMIRIIRSFKIK